MIDILVSITTIASLCIRLCPLPQSSAKIIQKRRFSKFIFVFYAKDFLLSILMHCSLLGTVVLPPLVDKEHGTWQGEQEEGKSYGKTVKIAFSAMIPTTIIIPV